VNRCDRWHGWELPEAAGPTPGGGEAHRTFSHSETIDYRFEQTKPETLVEGSREGRVMLLSGETEETYGVAGGASGERS
jgi:hypothetical protein